MTLCIARSNYHGLNYTPLIGVVPDSVSWRVVHFGVWLKTCLACCSDVTIDSSFPGSENHQSSGKCRYQSTGKPTALTLVKEAWRGSFRPEASSECRRQKVLSVGQKRHLLG